MSDPIQQEPAGGRVWLLADNPREPELVFDFPFDEELNEAVKRLPRRWFDWRRRNWRVPADPRLGRAVEEVLGRFPELVAEPEVLAWLTDSGKWKALVTVVARDGRGAFVLRTISGDPPPELASAETAGEGRLLLPFDRESAELLRELEGLQLDDLALGCARDLRAGREPAGAELTLEVGDDGEPAITLRTRWDPDPARAYKRLPEAHPVPLHGRFFKRDGGWAVAVPGDPALAPAFAEFLRKHPGIALEDRARDLIDELQDEHDRAAETVALSYAEDAELDGLELGGELRPLLRGGVGDAGGRGRP
jgi:hypothetical protein